MVLILLLCGCKSKNNVNYSKEFCCCFSSEKVTGYLYLRNDIITINNISINNEPYPIEISITESDYTISDGNILKKFSFNANNDLPPIVVVGKIVFETHIQKSLGNANVKIDNNGNINEIVINNKIYELYNYKKIPGQWPGIF